MESALTTFRKEKKVKQVDLAAQIGVLPPALSKWERGRVPAGRVLTIERITGIPRHALRPDLYPAPAEASAA